MAAAAAVHVATASALAPTVAAGRQLVALAGKKEGPAQPPLCGRRHVVVSFDDDLAGRMMIFHCGLFAARMHLFLGVAAGWRGG